MDYIPVPNTAQLELIGTLDGQRIQNVLHYVKATPWNASQLQQLCASGVNKWNVHIKPLVAAAFSLVLTRATDLSSQTGEVVTYSTGLPLSGQVGIAPVPNNVALVFTKRTALRGRSYRGRIYHAGLTTSQVTNNTVVVGAVNNLLTAWTQFMALSITDDEPLLCVVSRHNNGQARVTGVATLVTNLTTDGQLDSQRRRLPGRGN